MNCKTALGTAGALTLTSAAAVSALFLTIGNGGAATAETPTPEVVTEYVIADSPAATPTASTIYEIEYVEGPSPTVATYDDEYDEYDEYEDDEDEDDDDEDDEDDEDEDDEDDDD